MLILQKLLVKIYQNQNLKKKIIIFPNTKTVTNLIKKLTVEGFLYGYKPVILDQPVYPNQKFIVIYLKYYKNQGTISFFYRYLYFKLFQRISYKKLLSLKNFSPLILIQTTQGLLTHLQAIKFKLGGTIIFISI